jgi:tubulin---tyrosine ligase
MEVYFFKEGYLRTSCFEYSNDNLDNEFVHLTNNAIQSKNPNYGQLEAGNMLSFADFKKHLNQQARKNDTEPVDFDSTILPRMKY